MKLTVQPAIMPAMPWPKVGSRMSAVIAVSMDPVLVRWKNGFE